MNRIIEIILVGNDGPSTKDEDIKKACDILDNYLLDDDNNLLTAYLDCLAEFDMDMKILKSSGISVEYLKKQLTSTISERKEQLISGINNTGSETDNTGSENDEQSKPVETNKLKIVDISDRQ